MALTTGTKLNVVERRDFSKRKKRIHAKLADFIVVGNDLRVIRDSKLYRETHKTFEAFVKDEFNLERPTAYRFIEAAEVDENLSPIGDKKTLAESHYREVAKAPAEMQIEVVETAEEVAKANGRSAPVAKDYATAREQVVDSSFEDDTDTPVGAPSELEAGGYEPEEYAKFKVKAIAELERVLRNVERYGEFDKPDDYTTVLNTIEDLWKALQRWK